MTLVVQALVGALIVTLAVMLVMGYVALLSAGHTRE